MTTLSALIEETKSHLLGNTREQINVLNGALDASTTSVVLSDAMGSITAGAEIEIDQEVMRVRTVSGQTATVLRGNRGSTAATHSDGALVTVNPRFYRHRIIVDLNHALGDMSGSGLYQEVAVDLTFSPTVSGYDLTGSTDANLLQILEVRYKNTGPEKRFPVISKWSLLRDMATTDFSTGNALVIDSPGFPGLPLRVRYARDFTDLVALTDDLTTTAGVPATAEDLPPIGAAIRQMAGRDIKRSFLETQPDTRRTGEVPPGIAQGAITTLRRMWAEGVDAERMRQVQRYPYRQVM